MPKEDSKMRLFFLIFATICVILNPIHGIMELSAQEVSGDYTTQQQRPPFSTAAEDDSPFSWWVFHSVWTTALIILLLILYRHRDRKQKITSAGKVKNEPPRFNEIEKSVGLITLIALALAALILIIAAQWLAVAILIISVFALYAGFPEIFTKLLLRGQEYGNKTKETPKYSSSTEEKTRFESVGGLDDIIEEFREIIYLLKNPKEAEEWDITPPKGILLYGPPGCGKTLLARAVAGEAGVPFFQHSGASIGTSYVRSGAQHVIKIFEEAFSKAPSIIFIDEFDALGRRRGQDPSGEFDHALTEILHQMDGIKEKSGLLLIAATNREDAIDEALMRPGRFGRGILVPPPDKNGRLAILKIHTLKKPLAKDVNLVELAERTAGFSGDDIRELANKAAVIARRRYETAQKEWNMVERAMESVKGLFAEQKIVTREDFERALDEIRGGLARKSALSPYEQKIIARHEMGHAIVTVERGLEVLEKITLTQRNWALGMTISRSEEMHLITKETILSRITSLLGGRAAEKVFLGPEKITSGAANDFEKAAELARRMVCEWGMGEAGAGIFAKLDSLKSWVKPFSEHTARKIDDEVQNIIDACMADAEAIVEANKDIVEYLADLLVQKVTIDGKELLNILEEQKRNKTQSTRQ